MREIRKERALRRAVSLDEVDRARSALRAAARGLGHGALRSRGNARAGAGCGGAVARQGDATGRRRRAPDTDRRGAAGGALRYTNLTFHLKYGYTLATVKLNDRML